ncbi:MAG: hypothetical protein KKA90_05080 [Nanoarchaeota archaeon]|nr:hypothetical protein [Nanoarchaeota archaeon]
MKGQQARIVFYLFFIVLFAGATILPFTQGATTTDSATVTLSISTSLAISVNPATLAFGNVSPGGESPGQLQLIIKNTGSNNISFVFITSGSYYGTSKNPLPGGDPNLYNASSFVFLRNSTNATFFHAGRVEWNLSDIPGNATMNTTAGTEEQIVGWYRNNTGWYLFRVDNGSTGWCNASTIHMVISEVEENSTSMYRDLSVAANVVTGTIESNNSVLTAVTFASGPLNDNCVYIDKDCKNIFITKYDLNSSYPACSVESGIRSSNFAPGDEETVTTFASVPEGVPAGVAGTGTLTITASE